MLPCSFTSKLALPLWHLSYWLKIKFYKLGEYELHLQQLPWIPLAVFLQRSQPSTGSGEQSLSTELHTASQGLMGCSWQRPTDEQDTGDCVQPAGSGGRGREGSLRAASCLMLTRSWVFCSSKKDQPILDLNLAKLQHRTEVLSVSSVTSTRVTIGALREQGFLSLSM